jgi:protein-L-isoaspartate(D-aspartate) O-methyltransferase
MMRDSFVHKGKRKNLVEYLRYRIGISDENVLSAMNEVPRHLFIESIFEDFAYEDRAFLFWLIRPFRIPLQWQNSQSFCG